MKPFHLVSPILTCEEHWRDGEEVHYGLHAEEEHGLVLGRHETDEEVDDEKHREGKVDLEHKISGTWKRDLFLSVYSLSLFT